MPSWPTPPATPSTPQKWPLFCRVPGAIVDFETQLNAALYTTLRASVSAVSQIQSATGRSSVLIFSAMHHLLKRLAVGSKCTMLLEGIRRMDFAMLRMMGSWEDIVTFAGEQQVQIDVSVTRLNTTPFSRQQQSQFRPASH